MPAATLWERLIARARRRAMPPALILVPADPLGGLEEAVELARQELCAEGGIPDCVCPDCRLQRTGNHPDVRVVVPEGKISFKVEQIRDLREEAQKPPYMGAGKFFIFHPAHWLNPHSANALLKVLEEPMPATHFLLVTSQPLLLLPTIRSRCFCVPLPQTAEPPEPPEDLRLLWERWRNEGTETSRMQFLKRLSVEEYARIPRVLLGLWRADPSPLLTSLAQGYLRIFASTPPTFSRQLALECLEAGPASVKPLSTSSI